MSQKKIWATLHPFYETGAIMGRGVANEDFLRALLKFNPYDEYHFYLADEQQVNILKKRLLADFPHLPLHFDIQYNLPAALQKHNYHLFHLSDWLSGYVPLARLRNALSREIFPITGIIHSLSYARYHGQFLQHLWPGCTKRDASVVSSQAGKEVMEAAFSALRQNYCLPASFKQPQLVKIPLGIGEVPEQSRIAAERASLRQELNLAQDSILLLYVGRISHYSKMDFLPLLRALQRAGELGVELGRAHLLLAGWNEPDDKTPNILGQFAKTLGLGFSLVSRPDMQMRSRLYAAADIFVTPSDNLQETFGITILEAGAYGLPVLASNFDGYRDTLVQGETGFMATSIGPRNTDLTDSLAHFWFDNQYHLQLAQQTVVNVPEMACYLSDLMQNKALRLKMGQAGRKRVESLFVWEKIIPQYVKMWEDLRNQPVLPMSPVPLGALGPPVSPVSPVSAPSPLSPLSSGPPCSNDLSGKPHPAQLAYAQLFAGHFELSLNENMRVRWSRAGEALYRGFEAPVFYAGVEKMLPPELQQQLLRGLMFQARKPVSVGELVRHLNGAGRFGEQADFIVLWALKHDFLELV